MFCSICGLLTFPIIFISNLQYVIIWINVNSMQNCIPSDTRETRDTKLQIITLNISILESHKNKDATIDFAYQYFPGDFWD